MDTAVVNGEISIDIPEGFRILNGEELNALYADSNPNRWGMTDDERHMVVSIFWHKNNPLLTLLAGAKDACKATERKLSKALRGHEYVLEGFFQRSLCGKQAYGFRHRYDLRGETYTSYVILFMKGSVCYTVYCYVRVTDMESSIPVLQDILQSMR